jgi:hypothetical protein
MLWQGFRANVILAEHFMELLLDVIAVQPKEDGTLLLEFANHEKRVFDMKPYLEKKPLVKLQHSPLFMRATVDYGTVVWPGNIDIAPETLWDRSVPV